MHRSSIICISILYVLVLLTESVSLANDQDQQNIPASVYSDLDYVQSLFNPDVEIDPGKVSDLVNLIRTTPADSSLSIEKRNGAAGAFYTYSLNSTFSDFLNYAYNPDIPPYVTSPSSLQYREWLTPEIKDEFLSLIEKGDQIDEIDVLRFQESETITPDIHTGGYYTYQQDRLILILPDPSGPVLISATIQHETSDIGKKGCVVGDDKNWNYLYSEETGLNKTGLGWVRSYMYESFSVVVYAVDAATRTINAGSIKWLDAGWSKINMVKSHHILKGMKRYVHDFKTILESHDLPGVQAISEKYRELTQMDDRALRQKVSPYLEALSDSKSIETCSDDFISMVKSGKYIQEMSNQEIIRILLLEYLKDQIGEQRYGQVDYHSSSAESGSLM